MKAILEFNLPEDQLEYDKVNNADVIALVLWEISYNLRKKVYYEIESKLDKKEDLSPYDGIDILYDNIHEMLSDYNINLDKLIQ